ncbi:hypothetical protein GJAV_G00272420 [Gymnothorax javanicus]|nr:hypothetical protein GJAV_G00272420 [Gymnothorax javanicus]
MCLFIYSFVLMSAHVSVTLGLRILELPPLNCTQEGLRCNATINNCLDEGWLKPRKFTPTGPEKLAVQLDVRADENGELVPVLVVNWTAQIDGSIQYMKGTEVHVLEMSINLNRCVHYVFAHKISPENKAPHKEWSFSLDRVVVDPDQKYMVSVYNLPKPNLGHDSYNVFKEITVPGCADARIMKTKNCVERGSLWKSNISLEVSKGRDGKAAITVGFNGHKLSEKYSVGVQCLQRNTEYQTVQPSNRTSLTATFALGNWPQTCCQFKVEVQPFFVHCRNDCIRRWKQFAICPSSPTFSPGGPSQTPFAVILAFPLIIFLLCLGASCTYFHRGKLLTDKRGGTMPQKALQEKPSTPKKVLLLYSLDHPLYRDVVLKLCGFLMAQCGTEVVLDLLDTAWLGAVGRMQWLAWQKQQIEKSSDKILILCSRGVRAKWKAMCGGSKVMLKEDLRSPTGDMLTPALSLIAPDLLRAAGLEKYIVAYFEDISSEDDIPAPFNITIKYKLMKHFEELYFRILDLEKHEPGRVNRIEGVAQDQYFNWPSGRALRDAVEAFQAYQLQNPDWFEKECVDSEDEVVESTPQHPLLSDACGDPIFQCVPEIKDGPPVLVNEVQFSEDSRGIQTLVPLVNLEKQRHLVSASHLGDCAGQMDSRLVERGVPYVLEGAALPLIPFEVQPSVNAEPALSRPFSPRLCRLEESPGNSDPVEDEEPQVCSPPSLESLKCLQALQESLGPIAGPVHTLYMEDKSIFGGQLQSEVIQEKGRLSGSDQGYMSCSPLQDYQAPLDALCRLQEACLLSSRRPSGGCPIQPDTDQGYGFTIHPDNVQG